MGLAIRIERITCRSPLSLVDSRLRGSDRILGGQLGLIRELVDHVP